MSYKLGLDTGGTYTDAVLVDKDNAVIASAKSLTTHHDLLLGLRGAIGSVLAKIENNVIQVSDIELVSLSTTLATNALVEGKGRSVALVLIGYTETQFQRARLPEALQSDPVGFVAGGHDAAGAEAQELGIDQLRELVTLHDPRVEAFAVSSMFAVRNPEHEVRARELIRQLSGKPVSVGHELSASLDAPRRALTAVLNARLIPLIKNLLDATQQILAESGITAPLMVVKGDGSLVSAGFAQDSPVETILSGPAASVVGARFLSATDDLLVSDMGGTTTDIALLRDGLPKIDPSGASVGGFRTMVEAVMISTHGLGGDSAVVFDREKRDFVIGPQRFKSLALLVHENPGLIMALKAQRDSPYVATYSAQFALASAQAEQAVGLSAQQRELWLQIQQQPIALLQLFEDQTMDRPLQRLVNRGLVLLSGFTPTDASHILGLQHDWDPAASHLAAQLLMDYSEYNHGPVFTTTGEFAEYIRFKLARETAMAMLETTLADAAGLPALYLSHDERRFIEKTFAPPADMPVKLDVHLELPVMGIGAPAGSYYPRVAELLHCELKLSEHGGVANALGAVVGSVRQSVSMTITAAGGKQVRVHSDTGPLEFDDLEAAASWCEQQLTQRVIEQASAAGAGDCQVSKDRVDNVVESEGQSVFFESTITVHATGRPATVS